MEHPEFAQRLAPMAPGGGEVLLDHQAQASHGFVAALVLRSAAKHDIRRSWLICNSPRHRERIAAELQSWGISATLLPEAPPQDAEGVFTDPEAAAEWYGVVETISRAESCTVIAGDGCWDLPAPSAEGNAADRIPLCPGRCLPPHELIRQLSGHGYERVPLVSARGQFAVRGGIIDVFPWNTARPLRIEFLDEEIESLRGFDIHSQGSVDRMDAAEIRLSPTTANATLRNCLRERDLVVGIGETDEPARIRILEDAAGHEGTEDFTIASFGSPLGHFDAGDFVLGETRRGEFLRQVAAWRRDGWDVWMAFSNKGEADRFEELTGQDLRAGLGIHPLSGELAAGFTIPALRSAVLSSSELFGRYRSPPTTRRHSLEAVRSATKDAAVAEMEEGDLVVHREYGLARFRGVHQGLQGEELLLEYHGGSTLGVPLDQSHLVGKYIGLGGSTPELDRLGGNAWRNTRKAAEASIRDFAAQLLRVQAQRESETGTAHPPDSRWMQEFEDSFHHAETPDQLRAIEETKRDLESPRPMDRLICGDVGFGKTEVAIRAVFKVVTGGCQAAVLVPTTVLAEQHWRTFRERMSDYPLRIELLNRFRTPAEIRDTLRGLADGSVDVVIGTHRLISGDVSFRRLGLVVVDEEQRFGVAHKERFKELFRQVDVLTLSATPIPRTLYMALMGARDMSTIDTPPPNRVPVQTTVCAYDERVIRDAIRREMARGGQVFFLHNRVQSIAGVAQRLAALVPEARIVTGHGQMDREELESVMHGFVAGNADVLLATTIIETGIDIPNANTILIDRADRFGLADLYQLRGRVGRAGERAHAILLLPRNMITVGDARKRIHAIKQHTELGSGFRIAMRDLEIRGAGNLLGTKQSGHIARIGFDLYCRLLHRSVTALKGRGAAGFVDASLRADFLVITETAWLRRNADDATLLPAFLPSSWLAETPLRIAAYRELAECGTLRGIDDTAAAWRDRFGPLPEAVLHLLQTARIKLLAAAASLQSVEIRGQRLMLQRNGDYIMLEGRRFPELQAADPVGKLAETVSLLRKL